MGPLFLIVLMDGYDLLRKRGERAKREPKAAAASGVAPGTDAETQPANENIAHFFSC
jgi:hypothetical protein